MVNPVFPPAVTQPPVEVGNTRIIENKGIYVFSEQELSCWRLRVLCDVIVEPAIVYKSFKPNEPEQYFGVFQIVEGGYVISQHNVKYLHQQVYRYQNDPAKALFDSVLAGHILTVSIFNTAAAILNSIPASANITYSPYEAGRHLATPATEIWFKAVPGCKLAIHTEYLPLPQIGNLDASIPEPAADSSPSAPSNPGGDPNPPDNASPSTPPTPPYDPPTQDNDRTTPTGNTGEGAWVMVYSGFNPGCAGTYSDRRFTLSLATDPNSSPTEGSRTPGTCGETSFNVGVLYNGSVIEQANDITAISFVYEG